MKKKKGFARVEFIANLKEIKALHESGHNKRMIYDHLAEKGKVTMSYAIFCSYTFDGVRRKKRRKPKRSAITQEDRPFVHKNIVTKEDLDELI